MGIYPVQESQPLVNVRGGFLRSLENNVAIVRGIGFETHIKIFQPLSQKQQIPLTILVENVRGDEVEITQHGGVLSNTIRSNIIWYAFREAFPGVLATDYKFPQ